MQARRALLLPLLQAVIDKREVFLIFKQIREYIKNTDRLYLVLCMACSGLSCVTLVSLGESFLGGNYRRALVQAAASIVGIAAAIFISTLDYHSMARAWPVHATVAWGLVLLTFFIGYAPAGTTNKAWISLPFDLSLQPTELAKISFILTFALHLSRVSDRVNEPRVLLRLLAHIAAPAFFIILQGDDGTMIVFVLIAITMLFAAGLSYRYIAAAAGAAVIAAPVLWFFFLGDYQKSRILGLFHPEQYPVVVWQQAQGEISIGAGQILGKGFFGVEHHTVPLAYNDFIFAYIAESVGFIGCIAVLALLLGLATRTLYTARRSEDSLGYFICIGIFAMLLWQVIINVGMCLFLMPVIGITLPLLSAGGTSVLTTYLAIGVALSVYMHNRTTLFDI